MLKFPFILDPAAKSAIFYFDALFHVYQYKLQQFFINCTQQITENEYFSLIVRRDQIVEDALSQLSNVSNFLFHVTQTFQNTATQLKKRMKVIFAGEPGVDQGGVTKEFFQLIARRLFNLSYGA